MRNALAPSSLAISSTVPTNSFPAADPPTEMDRSCTAETYVGSDAHTAAAARLNTPEMVPFGVTSSCVKLKAPCTLRTVSSPVAAVSCASCCTASAACPPSVWAARATAGR